MAPQQKSKKLTLDLPCVGKGPNNVPLYMGAPGNPARVTGTVKFDTNYDCKGNDITIHYRALTEVKWSKKSGNKTTYYSGENLLDERVFTMQLNHAKPGTVSPGSYSTNFEVVINPALPSSSVGTYGWTTYRVKVILERAFPSTNLVQEQVIWVLNSCIPTPKPNAPLSMSRFNGTFMDLAPYICVIPSDILYLGQQVPITFKSNPLLWNAKIQGAVQVVSATIKLKQYTTLRVKSGKKADSKDILNIGLNDGWPVGVQGQAWQRTIVVPLPGAPTLTPSMDAEVMVKTHKLKLIMQVRVGNTQARELRVEMPVTITGPRPSGEAIPSFDLNKYLLCVDTI